MGKDIFAQARSLTARRPLAILLLLCVIAWLPGFFTLPPLDRDESRFAQASKQMLETGEYIDIRFNVDPRYKKPAGIYWMQAASATIFGSGEHNQIWTYRVPSLIGAFAAAALAFRLMRIFAGIETAFLGSALLGLTVSLSAEVHIAKTDAVLLATILGTQTLLLTAYLSARDSSRAPPSRALMLWGWVAFGIGVMIKGPIIIGVCLVTILAVSSWDREWRWFGRAFSWQGLGLALLIILPWSIAIGLVSQGLFYVKSLGEDFALKIFSGQETHGEPPGYYLALASFTFWPATLAAVPGILWGIKRRKEPHVRYLLAWAGANWAMFEAVPTKLPHYILPAYPALAFLAALWLSAPIAAESRWERGARYASLALFAIVGLAFATGLALAPQFFGSGSPWWLYAGAAGLAAIVLTAAWCMLNGRRFAAGIAAAASAILFYVLAGVGAAPHLEQFWLSPRLAAAVAPLKRDGDPPVTISGYDEPSLVFLLGTDTRIANGVEAAKIGGRDGGLVLIESGAAPEFLATLQTERASAQMVGEVDGINYSRGREARVVIYRVTPGAKTP